MAVGAILVRSRPSRRRNAQLHLTAQHRLRLRLWLVPSAFALLAQGCVGATQVADEYAYGAGSLNLDPWAVRPKVRAKPAVAVARAEAPRPAVAKAEPPKPEPPKPEPRPQPIVHREPVRAEPVQSAPPPRVNASPIVEPVKTAPEPVKPVIEPPREQHPQTLVGTTRTEADLRGVQRVESAAALLGTPGLQDRAFVAHVLRAAGQDLDVDRNRPYAPALYEMLQKRGLLLSTGAALPGDLIFFKNTADLNSNGKPDDGVTLVGVVERIDGSRVVLIAQRAGKVRRLAVDPTRPELVRNARGEVVNTRLVRWPGAEGPLTAGQCLAGFARP